MKSENVQLQTMKDDTGYLYPEQIERIIDTGCTKVIHKTLLMLLWKTGGRISEVLNLKKSDILFREGAVRLINLKRKGGKEETKIIPLDADTLNHLRLYVTNLTDEEKLFKFSRFMAFKIVRDAGKRVGITVVGKKKLHPHHFRHSFAIHATKKGVPVSILKDLLGHSELSTTAFYQKFNLGDKREAIKKMWGIENNL